MRVPFACAAVLSITVSSAAQSLEPRVHDLGPLLRPSEAWLPVDGFLPFVSPLPGSVPGSEWDEDMDSSGARRFGLATGRSTDAEPITAWLLAAMHRDGDPGVIRSGEVRLGRWLVEASAAVQQRLAQRLVDLEAAALRPISVEVLRLPSEAIGAAAPGALDHAAVDELLSAHPPLAVWRTSARCGEPVVLRNGEARSILRDFDIEVAEGMVIGDPKMDVLAVGLLGSVLVARAPRGGAVLTLALRRTEDLAPQRARETEFGRLRTPRVATELHRLRVGLRDGGAILFGGGRPRASAWLVRVRGLGGRRPDLVTLGGIGDVPWQPFDDRFGERPLRSPGEEDLAVDGDDERGLLPDVLEGAIADHDDAEGVSVLRLGDALVAVRESAALGRLQALASAFAAGSSVTLRYGVRTVDAATAAGLLDGSIEAVAVLSPALATGRLPTRVGDLCSTFVGVERAFVRDQDVEIASKSSGANPVVDTWLEGVFLDCRVEPAGDQGYRLRCEVAVQRPGAGPEELSARSFLRGPLDAPQVEHARAEIDLELAGGEWRCAAVVPIGVLGQHLAVALRVDG